MVLPDCTDQYLCSASAELLEECFFDLLSSYFRKNIPKSIAVGVSGGVDSLALTYLLMRWKSLHCPDLLLVAFIVDHGVRSESSVEALRVSSWLRSWGVPSYVLCCQKNIGNGQARWRKARYKELFLACHAHQISLLMLAHHQDDVLETVWMRRQALSDWRGCAGISSHRIQWDVHVVRPLLAWPKQCMYRILKHIRHPWIEDPSNRSPEFQRWKARCVIKSFSYEERQMFWKTILALAVKRNYESLKWAEKVNFVSVAGGYGIFKSSSCFQLPVLQGARVLSQWICGIVPRASPLRQESLCHAWRRVLNMDGQNSSSIVFTLGGCVGINTPEVLYCFREWGRVIPEEPPKHLSKGPWIWDQRFLFFHPTKGPVSAIAYGKNLYTALLPKVPVLPKYVQRLACASMPNISGGILCHSGVPCPIFALPLEYSAFIF
ncbi:MULTISPECIES: tRNA lysidine(34) synthetase TilS [Holospora]|uniref:tRNA(Ile)-lysidine synthase n=2 Tax=Holospora TaxID=44747 RepID=A0A061JHC8_9PROT|nr:MULTISPECIES: tRNA lysidine(34) synthetase TilS [Holospora]ETZ04658.1 tRNA(Ile)-lysidine synthase [Holospora undulata HU1]GAJ46070.1 tRNA(Ile)-lysidine synthase [Holospora elegans E1]